MKTIASLASEILSPQGRLFPIGTGIRLFRNSNSCQLPCGGATCPTTHDQHPPTSEGQLELFSTI